MGMDFLFVGGRTGVRKYNYWSLNYFVVVLFCGLNAHVVIVPFNQCFSMVAKRWR